LSDTNTKAKPAATRLDTAAPTVVPEGKYTRITYKGLSIITEMPLVDARNFAATFADQADQKTRQELRNWLGGISAVVPASRDALVADGEFGIAALAHENQAAKSAIEHTDPFWRHLGIDETAGDPDMRTFEKTERGFIRDESTVKPPGLPDDGGVAHAQKQAEKDFALEVADSTGVPAAVDTKGAPKGKDALDTSDPVKLAEAIVRSKPIN
jgi:hypothetical protein